MKKLFTIIAALACMGSVLTSCEKDNNEEPKAQIPTDKNFLNTPPTVNFTYDLVNTETVTITVKQPDYGVGTIPTYAIEVSLDPEFKSVPSQWVWNDPESTPQPFIVLPAESNKTTIEIPARDIADAINGIRGYNDLAQLDLPAYSDYSGPVYLRVRSYFPDADAAVYDQYAITSNVVTFVKMLGYKTLRLPGYIFLVGAPEGWVGPKLANAEHYEDWKLFEADDKIGSKIYSATFDIAAGQFQFRFYTALTDWDGGDSFGAQESDNPVDIEFNENGVYAGAGVMGKGSWQDNTWAGGKVTMTVNLKAKTVEFKKVD